MTIAALLLLLCLIGGLAGFGIGVARRDVSIAMIALIVVALSAHGLFG